MKTSTNVPSPPQRPTPTPPALVPITMAPSTTSASRMNTRTSIALSLPRSSARCRALRLGEALDDRPGLLRPRQCVFEHGLHRLARPRTGVDRGLPHVGGVLAQPGDGVVESPLRHGLELVQLGPDLVGRGAEVLHLRRRRVLLTKLRGSGHEVV